MQILADFSIVKKTVDIQTSVATCYKSFSLTQYASVWTRQLVLKFSDCNKSFKRKEHLKILIENILYWNTFLRNTEAIKKKREREKLYYYELDVKQEIKVKNAVVTKDSWSF